MGVKLKKWVQRSNSWRQFGGDEKVGNPWVHVGLQVWEVKFALEIPKCFQRVVSGEVTYGCDTIRPKETLKSGRWVDNTWRGLGRVQMGCLRECVVKVFSRLIGMLWLHMDNHKLITWITKLCSMLVCALTCKSLIVWDNGNSSEVVRLIA